MSDTRTISEVMQELKDKANSKSKLVRNWHEMLPPGSRWFPGCPGNPACKVCEGIGYLRIEGLPVSHPYFGKLVLCDCTAGRVAPTKPQIYDANNLRTMPAYVEQS
jgi:hypothetical protein